MSLRPYMIQKDWWEGTAGGRVLARMWASPGADVGESWRCGRVLARMWAAGSARPLARAQELPRGAILRRLHVRAPLAGCGHICAGSRPCAFSGRTSAPGLARMAWRTAAPAALRAGRFHGCSCIWELSTGCMERCIAPGLADPVRHRPHALDLAGLSSPGAAPHARAVGPRTAAAATACLHGALPSVRERSALLFSRWRSLLI